MTSSSDRIEMRIELNAPPARVWRALTDHREFGQWFRVNLEAPFVPRQSTRGRITYPGYEHLIMEVVVQKMVPERLFSFHWHPYAVDPKVDYSKEPPTLVEFKLEKTPDGTRLKLVKRLSGGSRVSIARLTQGSTLTRQAMTKHLRVLQDAGLVRGVRRGREYLFGLEAEPLDDARRILDDISRQWDVAFA